MILKVLFEEQLYKINIPQDVIEEGEAFFQRMNNDMDKGWQMGREWVDMPDLTQRCQIAADRLVDAINSENEMLASLMAGFIVTQRPGTRAVNVSTAGEPMETELA